MKTIHQINKWALILTVFLYITVYLGMAAQIVLGILQLFFAITITVGYYNDLPVNYKKLIQRYWFAVFISGIYIGVIHWLDINYVNDFFMITSLFIIPMLTASYFVYVTYCISKTTNDYEY